MNDNDSNDNDPGLGAPRGGSGGRSSGGARPSSGRPSAPSGGGRVAPPAIGHRIPPVYNAPVVPPGGGIPPVSAPPSGGPPAPPSGGPPGGSAPPSGGPPGGGGGGWGGGPPGGGGGGFNPPTAPPGSGPPGGGGGGSGGPPDFSNEPLLPPGGTPIPPGQTGVSCCRCVYITKASDKYEDIPGITGVDMKTLNFMNGGYAHTYSKGVLIGGGLEIVLPPAACVTGLTKGIEDDTGLGDVRTGSNCVPTSASFTQRALVRYADGSPKLLAPGETLPPGTWAPEQMENGSWGVRILFGGTFTKAVGNGVRVFELPRNAVLVPSDGVRLSCGRPGVSGIEDEAEGEGVGKPQSFQVAPPEEVAPAETAIVLVKGTEAVGVGEPPEPEAPKVEAPKTEAPPRVTTVLSKMDVRLAARKKNSKLFRQ